MQRFSRPLKVANESNTVTTDVCEACGAEAREDTLFCYNCGESLVKTNESPELKPVGLPETALNGASKLSPQIKEGPGMPSAATIKNRSKSSRNKPVQIRWEPLEESSDALLIAVSVGLFIIVVLIVGMALYFK